MCLYRGKVTQEGVCGGVVLVLFLCLVVGFLVEIFFFALKGAG